MADKDLEFYEDEEMPDKEVQDLMEEEIAKAPKAPGELRERLTEHNSTSPELSGGDVDAEWEDANDSGAESVGGHNPTPDMDDTEANAEAFGVTYEDNEPLDFEEKIEKRDRNRFELREASKDKDDSI